jgi:hypothetical protein
VGGYKIMKSTDVTFSRSPFNAPLDDWVAQYSILKEHSALLVRADGEKSTAQQIVAVFFRCCIH